MKKQDTKTSPPVKVVGFRVEGAAPSPGDSTLADALDVTTGSPSPVIIPPALGPARTAGDATPTLRPAVAPESPPSVSSGPFQLDLSEEATTVALPSIRTESHGLDPDSFAVERTPTKSQPGASPMAGSRTLPLTPVGASAPADLGGQFAAMAGVDSPRVMMQQPAASPEQAAAAADDAMAPAITAPPILARVSPRQLQQQAQFADAFAPQQPAAAAPLAPSEVAPSTGAGPQPGPPAAGEGKKPLKEMTKAERRALQEAQRAAKAAAKAGQSGSGSQGGSKGLPKQGSGDNLARHAGGSSVSRQVSSAKDDAKAAGEPAGKAGRQQAGGQKGGAGGKAAAGAASAAGEQNVQRAKSAEMFAHLPQPRTVTLQTVAEQKGPPVPLPAIKLGLQYADGSLRGGNARCIAMLQTFMQCIQDFRTPPGREFAKEFSPALNNIINFLVSCRPLSVSMGNAIKAVKGWVEKMKLQPPATEQQAKDELCNRIADYLEQKIRFADRMLVRHACEKIQDGDTIMTYAYSSVVAATLVAAKKAGKEFEVVVVDSRPLLEGRRMMMQLLEASITCEYCLLGALSYEITEVDKVFLGAASVLSNGTVLSRVGTATVALMAAAQRVPVLVCCETYKFHDRVQLDSITHNELMHPEGLAHVQDRPDVPEMAGWKENSHVHLLSLAYDLMPADFVSVVVTEMGAVPATSVAVILREAQRDLALL